MPEVMRHMRRKINSFVFFMFKFIVFFTDYTRVLPLIQVLTLTPLVIQTKQTVNFVIKHMFNN